MDACVHPTRLTVGQHSSPEGGSGLSAAPAGTPLDNDSATLLILNRFTYGPRPGDIERLRAVGPKEWFRQQLNPQTVDDSALEARLAAFPAMQLPLDRLMELYPPTRRFGLL